MIKALRKSRLILLGGLLLIICVLFSSCSRVSHQLTDDPEMDVLFERAYASLYEKDEEAFRSLLHPDALTIMGDNGDQAIQDLFQFITEPLGEYRAVSRQDTLQTNLKQKQAIYAITLKEQAYHINMAYREDENGTGLAAFRLDEATEGNTGFTWPATAAQWSVFIFMVLSFAFIIITFMVCCHDQIRYKALMILMILLGNIGFLITVAEESTQFQLLLFQYGTFILQYIGSGFALRLFFPIGAIIYWCVRRLLRIPPTLSSEVTDSSPAEAENQKAKGQRNIE